ncbi:MAG: hypothetical protein ACL7BU_06740 [Candidatus Phlomobacter fragariae]
MKLNPTLLAISTAFTFELIAGHIAHAYTTPPAIFSQIKWGHEGLREVHLDEQELDIIGVLIVPALLIYVAIFIDFLRK